MQPGHYTIQITNPCQENWGQMSSNSIGRFCDSCQKSVVDFTGKSDDEITSYMLTHQDEKVCGRFRKRQVDRIRIEIDRDILFTSIPFWQKFLAVVLVCFGSSLFGVDFVFAQEGQDTTAVILEQVDSTLTEQSFEVDSLAAQAHDSIKEQSFSKGHTPETLRLSSEYVLMGDVIVTGSVICRTDPAIEAFIQTLPGLKPEEPDVTSMMTNEPDTTETITVAEKPVREDDPKEPQKPEEPKQVVLANVDLDRKRGKK